MVKDRQAWRSEVHGVAKSQTWLRDWTTKSYFTYSRAYASYNWKFISFDYLHSLPYPCLPPLATTNLLFLWGFFFFQIPHIIESIEYLSFSVCLISLSIIPSRFIHFVTHGMYIPSKLPGEVDATGVGTTLKVLGFWAISWILCVCKYFVRRGFIVTTSLKQSWTWKISRTIALKEIKV